MKLKVLIILVVLFFLSTIIAVGKIYRLRRDNISLKEKIEELQIKKKIVETKLKDKEEEISRLLTELEEKAKRITSLEEEKESLTQELRRKEEEVMKEREGILELQERLSKGEMEFKNLLARVKNLESIKKDLEKRLKELEIRTSAVELGKIEVRGEERDIQPITPSEKLEGKILVVNKEYDFAVINLGKSDGLNLSDILSVYHEDKHLGNVKVEELRDKLSVVSFLDTGIKDKIKEGDSVVFPSQ